MNVHQVLPNLQLDKQVALIVVMDNMQMNMDKQLVKTVIVPMDIGVLAGMQHHVLILVKKLLIVILIGIALLAM
jgi:hypothetical protein